MLFKSETPKSYTFSFSAQLWKIVLAGVVGLTLYFNPPNVSMQGTHPIPHIVSSGPATINQDFVKVLQGKSLAEQEKVYKVLAGLTDYCKNSERIHKNRTVRDVIPEVLATYKLESSQYSYLQDFINKAVDESGIRKDDDSIVKSKDKCISVFNTLAESAKYSIQTMKDK